MELALAPMSRVVSVCRRAVHVRRRGGEARVRERTRPRAVRERRVRVRRVRVRRAVRVRDRGARREDVRAVRRVPVSYTHLTLPTIYSV